MTTIPPVVPPLPIERHYARNLAPGAAFEWLRAGWRDLTANPGPSLLYGFFVFLLSAGIVAGLIWLAWDYALFPAIGSEEHTSELQSLMRISYAVFCLKKKKK